MNKYNFDKADHYLIEEVIDELANTYNISKLKSFDIISNYSNFLELLHEMPEEVHHDSPEVWAKHIYEQAKGMGVEGLTSKLNSKNVRNLLLMDEFEEEIKWAVKRNSLTSHYTDLIAYGYPSKNNRKHIVDSEFFKSLNLTDKVLRVNVPNKFKINMRTHES